MRNAQRTLGLFAGLGFATLVGCNNSANQELMTRLNEAGDKLLACKKETNDLTNEVKSLKRQLATAMADPSKLVLKDPEIIELIADLRGGEGGEIGVGKGDLNPAAASKIVMDGARALQQCYERALKKNASLQARAGVQLLLGLTVDAGGRVNDVSVRPSIDASLNECIESVAKRWKFPKFTGDAVTIEQKIMLTPKT
ncbi:MAG: AgmX/PglI C-terminal domain-containing protein [Myxococcales bacterium]|nr:AgmX/PglI C-terminal domain-containing protein [Myxococcales bacterium]